MDRIYINLYMYVYTKQSVIKYSRNEGRFDEKS
jgi:hypothetical protein